MSSSGMIPPPNTTTSSMPRSPMSSASRANSVMCAPESTERPDGVGVLLDDGLDDLLRRLVQAGVDDLHAGVAQRARDDLGAAVVPVEARLGDDHPDAFVSTPRSLEHRRAAAAAAGPDAARSRQASTVSTA